MFSNDSSILSNAWLGEKNRQSFLKSDSPSQAAITYSDTTGKFTGSVDLGAYYSGVEIAVAVVGVTLGIALFFNMLKKARG